MTEENATESTQTSLVTDDATDASTQNPGSEDDSTDQGTTDDKTSEGVDTSKKGEGKSDADEGDATGAPETYADFDMPEGMEVDAALLEKAIPVFKELNLTQEQAQTLVNLRAEEVKLAQEAQIDSFNQLTQGWLEQTQNDKEIGGEKLEQNVTDAKLFIDKFGTPGLKTLLRDTGVGNHVEVVRAFARAGALLKEDSPGSTGNPSQGKKDRADILYPSNA